MLAAGYAGRLVMRTGERVVDRVPVVRSVYGAIKQIFETVLARKSTAFRQVVLVEYPCRGTWAVGFITGVTEGEVQHVTGDVVVNVFVPATPNPTTGFLLFVPRQDVRLLDMTVEEGIKLVISGGIVTPQRRARALAGAPAGPGEAVQAPPMVEEEAEEEAAGERRERGGRRTRPGFGLMGRVRNYFLAGVLVTAPIGITIWLSWNFIAFVDSRVTPLIPGPWNPETYLPFSIPGLGVLVIVVGLIVIGMFATGLAGRLIMSSYERALATVPVVRSVYSAVKQIFETVLAERSKAFREVVLIQYPRPGSWALGFITGHTSGEVQDKTAPDSLDVFLPTTPNPTSGFLLFIPREEARVLSMTVEEGAKMIISGGIITPPHRPARGRRAPQGPVEPEPADAGPPSRGSRGR